jgi:23S rRNA pseudouridine1911/1915/1917 synthase
MVIVDFKPVILYEDNHLLIVDKPAGMLTQGDASGKTSLLEHCKAFLKKRDGKPGNVFLGMVQRLDKPVSGAMVLAKTSKAAGRISEQIRGRRLGKYYLAVTANAATAGQKANDLDHSWIEVAHRLQRFGDLSVAGDRDGDGQAALMKMKTLFVGEHCRLHAIRLISGRKHQIRAQLSALGMPICGDVKYGATCGAGHTDGKGIMLHSYCLQLTHPVRGTTVEVVCEPPGELFARFSGRERRAIGSLLAENPLSQPVHGSVPDFK